MNNSTNDSKEKLVVEVVAAHNLMPKDGEGSSSPFVEVEFENQRLRTQVKYKDLNPFGTKKLVFQVKLIFLTEPKRSASSLIFAPPSKSSLWSSFSYVARVVQASGG